MTPMRPTSAKILQHSEGLGTPTAEMVRKRAQELATINGHAEFTEEDWRDAKRELHGGHELSDTNGEMEMSAMVSEHDMVMGSVGHRAETFVPEDNENLVEELIAEGMDEAVHEQMLAARREADAEETEDEEAPE